MSKKIAIGDRFFLPAEKGWEPNECIRLRDDPRPAFECERMRIRVFALPAYKVPEQNFGVEPEWFRQRGLDFVKPTKRATWHINKRKRLPHVQCPMKKGSAK